MNNNAAGGVGGGGGFGYFDHGLILHSFAWKRRKPLDSHLHLKFTSCAPCPCRCQNSKHMSPNWRRDWNRRNTSKKQTSRAPRINGRVQEIKPVRPKSNILALEVATAKAEDWLKQHTAVSLSLSLPYRPASNWLGKQHCRRDLKGVINKSRDDCIASCCFLTFIVLTQSHFDFFFSVLFSCNL